MNKDKINIFSTQFLFLYIKHFFNYLPIFFKSTPWYSWFLVFKSSNRVAYETSKCVILIRREPDIWSGNKKKYEFINYYKNLIKKHD